MLNCTISQLNMDYNNLGWNSAVRGGRTSVAVRVVQNAQKCDHSCCCCTAVLRVHPETGIAVVVICCAVHVYPVAYTVAYCTAKALVLVALSDVDVVVAAAAVAQYSSCAFGFECWWVAVARQRFVFPPIQGGCSGRFFCLSILWTQSDLLLMHVLPSVMPKLG